MAEALAQAPMHTHQEDELPRPGLVGILIRLVLGIFLVYVAYVTVVDTPSFWDGYSSPLGSIAPVIVLAFFSRGVVNELVQKAWGWWPSLVLLAGLAVAAAVGLALGDPFGPPYGIYLWAWTLGFALLLGPAFLLASILRTPGCEMRSFLHLWAAVRGKDVRMVACPGWIDRFDNVRIFGRF